MCELKRGAKEQAAAQFRLLLTEFPNESDLIGKTRERLSELGQATASVVVRQLWANAGNVGPTRISPDGQSITFIDWTSGEVWLRDLRSGSSRKLSQSRGLNNGEYGIYSAFSPDGKRIAYDWWRESDGRSEIRIIGTDNSSPQVLLAQKTGQVTLGDWSPDGKTIAVAEWIHNEQATNEWTGSISLISIESGTIRKLTPLSPLGGMTLRFSPDGRYLAYKWKLNPGRPPSATASNHIFVVEIETGSQQRRQSISFRTCRKNLSGGSPITETNRSYSRMGRRSSITRN